jgi:hypothetical protein
MSSSRSIAAARNRRAGDSAPQPQPSNSRPGTSIASQPAFSQNKRVTQSQPSQQQQKQQQPKPQQAVKLSISDAIGLITLRLGRVEQFMLTVEHEGLGAINNTSVPDNTHLVDTSVINSIVNRLDCLEKKEKESVKFSSEVRDIKDLLMSQIIKYDKFTGETDKKFADIETAFVDLETNLQNNDTIVSDQTQPTLVEDSNSETNEITQTIFSVDLKNMIKQELSQASSSS